MDASSLDQHAFSEQHSLPASNAAVLCAVPSALTSGSHTSPQQAAPSPLQAPGVLFYRTHGPAEYTPERAHLLPCSCGFEPDVYASVAEVLAAEFPDSQLLATGLLKNAWP